MTPSPQWVVHHDPARPAVPFHTARSAYDFAKRTDGAALEVYQHPKFPHFYNADGQPVLVREVRP